MTDQQGLVGDGRITGDAVADDVADLSAAYLTSVLRPSAPVAEVTEVRAERIGTGQIGASYRLQLRAATCRRRWSPSSPPTTPRAASG